MTSIWNRNPAAWHAHEAGQRAELGLGRVRILAVVGVTILDCIAFANHGGTIPAVQIASSLVAIVVYALLRRPANYRGLRFVAPLIDAAIIFAVVENSRSFHGNPTFSEQGGQMVLGLLCALLAGSGGLRNSRLAPIISTALALGLLAWFSWRLETVTMDFLAPQLFILLAVGYLGFRSTDYVLRAFNLERFVPRDVTDLARQSGANLGTQTRSIPCVTILVTDLRGFTTFSATAKPEDVLAVLQRIQGKLAELVMARDGSVDKFLGDGMLAVFEPIEGEADRHANHADRAVMTAIDILGAMDAINADLKHPLPVGIGVHSGPVDVGVLGGGRRLEFTVIGDTVNTASRIESLTKSTDFAALVSETTMAALTMPPLRASLQSIGSRPIRGRDAIGLFGVRHRSESTEFSLESAEAALTPESEPEPKNEVPA